MQKDFHFTTTYVLARLAGFNQDESEIISSSSQFIDDATDAGKVLFDNHAGYEFFSSAHKMLDYRNFKELQNHYSWIPFHFLPGNKVDDPLFEGQDEFVKKLICQPNSEVAQLMIHKMLHKKEKSYSLYQLGITMHVYADTWAHQKFCGISHNINSVKEILDYKEDSHHKLHNHRIRDYFKKRWWERIFSWMLTEYSPLGHGPALSMPDKPFLKWQYTNYAGRTFKRDNTEIFIDACHHIYSALKSYKENSDQFKFFKIPSKDEESIRNLFLNLTDDDQEKRVNSWKKEIANGLFSFGAEDIRYRGEGRNCWRSELGFKLPEDLNGITKDIDYSSKFLATPWKLFHDAATDHRKTVLHEILPEFDITVV
jgi:hypothetical protein